MRRTVPLFTLLIAALSAAIAAGLAFGATPLSFSECLHAIATWDTASVAWRVLFYVRLPRVAAALLAGAALAVSGTLIQGVLHNPLAGPNLLGINAGAGFGAVLVMALFPAAVAAVPLAAFGGALFSAGVILLLAGRKRCGRVTVILAGVAVGSIFSAGIDLMKTVVPDLALDAQSFLIGGLAGVSLSRLFPAAVCIAAGLMAAIVTARAADILALGETAAAALGMRVRTTRLWLLATAALLAGAAVSFAGLLGFVGLLVPHVMRRFAGNLHRRLIPAAALGGGTFVLLCDLISRTLFAPYELPVGIVMSAVGAPCFLMLLLGYKRKEGDV